MSKPLYCFFIATLSFLCLSHSIARAYSPICSSSSGCGNGVPIRYPFWVKNNNSGQEYCGYPEFGVECSHGQPTITLPGDTFYVTDINYDYYTLTLVDMDVVNQSCPRARHNVSLGNFPLSFNYELNVNLSFYFNCSVSKNIDLPPNPISCLKNEGSKQSYVSDTYGLNIDCEEKVVVVVKEEEIRRSHNLETVFGEAMNNGFVLDWQREMDCVECEYFGGRCGHNQTNHQMLCFCTDGSISTKSCTKEGTFAFFL